MSDTPLKPAATAEAVQALVEATKALTEKVTPAPAPEPEPTPEPVAAPEPPSPAPAVDVDAIVAKAVSEALAAVKAATPPVAPPKPADDETPAPPTETPKSAPEAAPAPDLSTQLGTPVKPAGQSSFEDRLRDILSKAE